MAVWAKEPSSTPTVKFNLAATQTGAGPTTAALAGEVPREPRAAASTVDSSAFGSTAGATGSSATKTADPIANASTQRSLENTAPTQHNSSSLAGPAAVGAGAGLAGASIAGSQHGSGQTHVDSHDGRPSASTASTVPTTASSGIAGSNANTTSSVAHPYSDKAVDPRIDSDAHRAAGATTGTSQYQTLDPAAPVNKEQEHHYGRDAAVGGAAGAGAGALAGHEYSKKEAENQVKEQKAAEKEHAKEVKHAEKEHEKDVKHAQKEHEKDVKHAQKEHEKEAKHAEKEQKQHEKEIAKEQKQHEKDVKQHEKELEKERKQQEKAEKPGLLDRLLHRGDSKKEKHTEEAAVAGAATGAGAAGVHEHNKLHKDPPAGYGQEPTKGYASQVTGGTNTTALAQGNENILPAGSSTHDSTTVPGTRYGSGHDEHPTATSASTQPEYYQNDPAQGIKRDSVSAAGGTIQSTTPYQPAPQKGYASQVTGGTGTTQLASGNLDPLTNPTKPNPLDQGTYGPQGYASTVTGGTGTTQLAQGTTSEIPTTGMAPGRSGSVAGVETQTPYVDGPKAGTGKYADQVTGGTGTTQLAQGQESEVANPQKSSLTDKLEGALALK